ncbi:helix-turn-helix domain-containing protein [Streptomyces sp. PRKS01-29]|nr:helix-turn-helix domain-containing protein [Streptomyces sabulosicollis]MBI0293321.1 helix-turn-helix domain-containing protein [Streptomyces sabulosicollis]
MNTTTAAAQAGVTIPTIRTWCRRGVIAAIKTAGRWIVDAASLAHRIAIGAMRTIRQEVAINTPNHAALAAEARELATRLTPKRGCHPADRKGGVRDRASGTLRARGHAEHAAALFDLTDKATNPGHPDHEWAVDLLNFHATRAGYTTFDPAADGYDLAFAELDNACTAAANIRSIG